MTWAVGVPQSGKTTLALSLGWQLCERWRVPMLVLDSAEVRQLAGVEEASSTQDAIARVWGRPRSSVRFVPTDREEVDRLCVAANRGRDFVLIVDEAHYWISSSSSRTSNLLLRLMRATQHARVRIFLTTHHLSGDVPQAALSCSPELYLFRCVSPAVLEFLERQYGLQPSRLASLPRGAFLRVSTAFEDFA